MINEPIVSVVLPVYNCENYVKQAIQSILNQTFRDFELLIIDDASTDETVKIINSYTDNRIQLILKPLNSGYTNSLNYGIQIAKGKYIARMDGDDISMLNRFAKQVSFLEVNHEVIVCGSWFRVIGSGKVIQLPENADLIKSHLLRGNCIAHPSVMIRKESLNRLSAVYDANREPAEDYDLWTRLALIGKLHNLQEVLLDYRIHNNQVSNKQGEKQKQNDFEIKRNLYSVLDFNFLPVESVVFEKMLNHGNGIIFKDVPVFKKMQLKLLASNSKNVFEPKSFKAEILYLDKFIIKRCFLDKKDFYPITFLQYLQVKNDLSYKLNFTDQLKLFVKSMIFFKVK
ncbi:glycosyltransferase family 2 protein [Flavobacterium hiemivividum]|uniref:Glycosyltransferase n=1 Tax=Flavobacterium hiemivividum TaxID=2541734 RepID=A0A4R5CZK4_9FLAO|nr:glycosyltransferase [Flavobacterium hiemivividum]TDE04571.1 glycosyltransferase [Flavobacterium hiemivividum]